jgi:hypothetical protein
MNLKRLTSLLNRHVGETLNVIGRGPSLTFLDASDIGPGPIVAVSYAIQPVEALSLPNSLYSLQKDWWYCETSAPIFAHTRESLTNSAAQFEAHPGVVYGFDNPRDFRLDEKAPSLVACVAIAQLFGCQKIRAYCCDAMTTGSAQAYQDGQIVDVKFPANYAINGRWAEEYAAGQGIEIEWVSVKQKIIEPSRKILLFCPTYELNGIEQMRPETAECISKIIAPPDTQVDVVIGRDNPYEPDSHKNTLHQFQVARQKALDEGYAALFTVEHDMVVPPDALVKLDAVTDAQVVYGLYMLRNHGHGKPGGTVLNAFLDMPKNPTIGSSLSLYPDKLALARRKKIVPVSGCGFGCALIRRETLARFEFHASGPESFAPDWGLALDCQKAKVKQVCRFDVECGHIERGVMLMPFEQPQPYKVMPLATMWVNDRGESKRITKGVEVIMNYDTAQEMARAGYVRLQ